MLSDGTKTPIPIERLAAGPYRLTVTFAPLNKTIVVLQDGRPLFEAEAPKKCGTCANCGCTYCWLQFNL